MQTNGVMFQAFEWYLKDDGNYYLDMIEKLDELKDMGVDSIWLPPVTKAQGTNDTGYGVYDLYDLGEFDQKGDVRTKYGTKEQLHQLIDKIHQRDMRVYCDVVINHKAGADEEETFQAVPVDENDRTQEIDTPREIKGWTKFIFPGRDGKYSDFTWNFHHFNGVDYDSKHDETGIFRILGENKGWNYGVSKDKGNFDYLMFANIDHAHPEVEQELKDWIGWFIETLNIDGIRLDAVKHIDHHFMERFVKHVHAETNDDFYVLGEYWDQKGDHKDIYLKETNYTIDLFDVDLHYHFHEASKKDDYDFSKLFDNTLLKDHPTRAVTFVDNHDTQPEQSLESFVEPWFKPLAYAIILLRKEGYPCLFYGDVYGINQPKIEPINKVITQLAKIRGLYAYGDEDLYLDGGHCLGFVRHGDDKHPQQLITVMSQRDAATIKMFIGKEHAGKVFADVLGHTEAKVTIDDEGYGAFKTEAGNVSVYLVEGTTID